MKPGLAVTIATLSILTLTAIIAYISVKVSNIIFKRYVLKVTRRYIKTQMLDAFERLNIIENTTHLIPSFLFLLISPLLEFDKHAWSSDLSHVVTVIAVLFLLLLLARLIFSVIDLGVFFYQQLDIKNKQPITSYVQFVKILILIITGILVVSTLIDRSPIVLLTGLGAVSAVLLLVFKDTITGFVSSIQVSANDLVRVGDWITIPNLQVDGDVQEISINTVKIQNFDKTIVTVPTQSLISSGVKNWRGMNESGGRRIKRAIHIDIDSIKFCDDALFQKLSEISLLEKKIQSIKKRMDEYNQTPHKHQLEKRRFTNIGLFRYYIESYIRSLSTINFNYTCMVRQLSPSEMGLPLELYVFTSTTNWSDYEAIQADIFDHLLAAVSEFELKVFQRDRATNS